VFHCFYFLKRLTLSQQLLDCLWTAGVLEFLEFQKEFLEFLLEVQEVLLEFLEFPGFVPKFEIETENLPRCAQNERKIRSAKMPYYYN